jgi:hypothetical protein
MFNAYMLRNIIYQNMKQLGLKKSKYDIKWMKIKNVPKNLSLEQKNYC